MKLTTLNPLTPNDPYWRCTAPLASKHCIIYIYSTNEGTEYFKHCIYSPLFSLQNAVCFIILTYLVPYFHFSVQEFIYVNIANYLHFYYVISKILHIEYLKST